MLKVMLKIVKTLLLLMLWFDFMLHFTEFLGLDVYYFYFKWFYFSTRADYTLFWTVYWGLVIVLFNLMLILEDKVYKYKATR